MKIGTQINWGKYDPKQNLKNGQIKTVKILTNKKRIIYGNILAFDTNERLIGEFETQYDAAKKLNSTGIKISVSSIGQALKRDNHKSKNLYFYYKNEIEKGGMPNESNI